MWNVTKASERDRERVLAYLNREPEFNLFAIGDIMNLGMEADWLETILVEEQSEIAGLVFRFRDSLIPYSHRTSELIPEFIEILNQYLDPGAKWIVNGKMEILDMLSLDLAAGRNVRVKDTRFAVCAFPQLEFELAAMPLVEFATESNIAEAIRLLKLIPEFDSAPLPEKDLQREIREGQRHTTFIRDPQSGAVVSVASAVAESDHAGMIVGVGTHPEPKYRRRGYASACTAKLVEDLASRGKKACLFYDNPAAGSIYRKLGFRDIGGWRMMIFRPARES